jgi:DNA-binding NarL/FixJ family response regulator
MSVLIVDDHAGFRRFARAFLSGAGYEVVGESATGAEALAAVHALHPDVVLLDVGLPDIDGIELAGRLAAIEPRPAVVLTSSRAASDYGARLKAAPAAGFVAKAELSRSSLHSVLEGAGCGS